MGWDGMSWIVRYMRGLYTLLESPNLKQFHQSLTVESSKIISSRDRGM